MSDRRKPVLDMVGYIELLDHMGDDLAVVNAARVSYARESAELNEHDIRLIHRMMKDGHGSPFEHVVFKFRVKAPLFVVAQWERHRLASYNQQSGRYVEHEPEFYGATGTLLESCKRSYRDYQAELARGTPKEDARACLPEGTYTTFITTINLRSLFNFLAQRNSGHAQANGIRQYGRALEEFVCDLVPESYRAFVDHGRKAP